jgi:membrane protein
MSSANLHAPFAPTPRRSHVDIVASLRRTAALLKEAGIRWADDACYRMGASLAYYAIFSLFPLLLLAVTALGFFLGSNPATRERLLGSVASVMSPQFRTLLDDTLASMQSHQTARGVGAVVGAITLIFGASGAFSELENSINTIWRVEPAPSAGLGTTLLRALEDKAISLAAVAGAGAVLLSSLLVSTILGAATGAVRRVIAEPFAWKAIDAVVSLVFATVIFAVIFRLLPRTKVTWRDVLGGAFFTAVFFTVLKHLLAWYLGHVGNYAAYGAVGAMLGLLTWIYLVSLLLFFGAELTRVYAEREGSLARPPKG